MKIGAFLSVAGENNGIFVGHENRFTFSSAQMADENMNIIFVGFNTTSIFVGYEPTKIMFIFSSARSR
jgi:hypothetical protein